MLEWIKKHFIPVKENDFQPHFLRMKTAGLLLALVLSLEALYLFSTLVVMPRSDFFAAIFASVLIDQTNEARLGDHLSDLSFNALLEKAAQMKANDMAEKGYFAHNSPDGKTPWYWFREAGYDYAVAGENLAVNFTDSKDVTEAWLRSPGHRANIMNDRYTEIGIATARGTYKGKEAIFVVQEFGRPALDFRVPATTTAPVLGTEPLEIAKPVALAPKIPNTERPEAPVAPSVAPAPQKETPTLVAGAETQKLAVDVSPLSEQQNPAPEVAPREVAKKNVLVHALASPRRVTTGIFLFLLGLLSFALLLAIVIEIRLQFPHLIVNGAILIAIIVSVLLINSISGVSMGVI